MSDKATQEENPHLTNLINKIRSDFETKVKNENNPSNVLLKGHLLIENILEETLAAFDVKDLKRKSFFDKVTQLKSIKVDPAVNSTLQGIIPLLYSLNDTRNDLAHDLDFELSESSVNKIGVNLGSKFILQKYKTGHVGVKENLLFCLDTIVNDLGVIMYIQIETLKGSLPQKTAVHKN